MDLYDLAKISENLVLGLFREIYQLKSIRSLNAEKKQYPGVDLADDTRRIAIQVTATPTLGKVKQTLETFLSHNLYEKYDRLVVYVLTSRQQSYSQSAIDAIQGEKFGFDSERDILDYRALLSEATHCTPEQVRNALEVIRSFETGGLPAATGEEDFDPPGVSESLKTNLIEIFIPQTIYVADLVERARSSRGKDARNAVRKLAQEFVPWIPSGYVVHEQKLVTFYQLDATANPFAHVVDMGTVTSFRADEFYSQDENQERVFKALLRFVLQQKLGKHSVWWMQADGLFVFMPNREGDLLREETWRGEKESTRRVFERKVSKKDETKDFLLKHLAFRVEFHRENHSWYLAITPDWYFSFKTSDGYRRSRFADEHLGWIKRHENNDQVANHFRFIAAWLNALDQEDLFRERDFAPAISFGDEVVLSGHPALPDDQWRPPKVHTTDDAGLFTTAREFE